MEQLLMGMDSILLGMMTILDGGFSVVLSILNFQPFGDHGTMSLLSIRMFHILGIYMVWNMMRGMSFRNLMKF